MKILRVIGHMDPVFGGPCQGVRNSIPELEQLGHHNEVVCLDAPDAGFLGQDPFPIHALGPCRGSWGYAPTLIPWLIDNLPRFDAVIVHGLWLYQGYAVRKALVRLKAHLKLPCCYVMPHGMLDPYFQRDPSRRLKALRNWIYWKLIERKVVNGADGVLFTCEEELQLAREPFRLYRPKREVNIGYGVVAPPTYAAAMKTAFVEKCPDLRDKPYLLFLSRIHPKKGVNFLIRAYADLVQQLAASSVSTSHFSLPIGNFPSLVIAGPLDSAFAREMQALAKELLPASLK
ncbi:glycosyltransferase, partial [Akkermansiaceae bacterium]|nr:glycosyltransferase [Akkermansiaceae bacterium]